MRTPLMAAMTCLWGDGFGRSWPSATALMPPYMLLNILCHTRVTTSVSFWPPKPKLLLRTASTLALRAWLGT